MVQVATSNFVWLVFIVHVIHPYNNIFIPVALSTPICRLVISKALPFFSHHLFKQWKIFQFLLNSRLNWINANLFVIRNITSRVKRHQQKSKPVWPNYHQFLSHYNSTTTNDIRDTIYMMKDDCRSLFLCIYVYACIVEEIGMDTNWFSAFTRPIYINIHQATNKPNKKWWQCSHSWYKVELFKRYIVMILRLLEFCSYALASAVK